MAAETHNSAAVAAESACWSCSAQLAAQFCAACGKVQPPLPADYFRFFGLPRRLNLDVTALEREFYRLSRRLHPDVYARSSPQEQAWALEQSSRLNDAYRTLRDPIGRTEYLLKLEGIQLEEQSKAATDQARATGTDKKQIVPPDLLEEVFELNLQLEELRAAKKTGHAADEQVVRDLTAAKRNFESRLLALQDELQRHWDEWDSLVARAESGQGIGENDRHAVLDKMVTLLNKRSYIRNLVRDVTEALES
jgi:molecular chaperone HscB